MTTNFQERLMQSTRTRITAAMIAMGHIMDLGVVSEGVENEEQLETILRNL